MSVPNDSQYLNNECSPLVTVAMPVYNAGRFLRQAVLSIVGQSFSNWELIIIDDGSTDGSFEAVGDIRDQRIQILRDGSNKGLAVRLNEAIDRARGCFFARMDQDDISYPERFSRQLEILQNNQDIDLVGVRSVAISETDEVIGTLPYAVTHEEICAQPWRGFYLAHPTWMGKIEWFRKHRYADPAPYLCEDQEILLRSYSSSRFAMVPEVLFAYRMHRKNVLDKSVRTRWAILKFQFRYFMGSSEKHLVLPAALVFFSRIIKDLLASLFQVDRDFLSGVNSKDGTYDFEIERWDKVHENLKSCVNN